MKVWHEISGWNSRHRIVVEKDGLVSKGVHTGYEFIAEAEVDGRKFIGVTDYFEGVLPNRGVFEVIPAGGVVIQDHKTQEEYEDCFCQDDKEF